MLSYVAFILIPFGLKTSPTVYVVLVGCVSTSMPVNCTSFTETGIVAVFPRYVMITFVVSLVKTLGDTV